MPCVIGTDIETTSKKGTLVTTSNTKEKPIKILRVLVKKIYYLSKVL